MDCLFCKIVNGEISANVAYEDEEILCFHDIKPQAPVHLLFIPKKHIKTIDALESGDQMLMGHLLLKAKEIARQLNIADDGYRLVFNVNTNGGQEVYHIHLHLLAGRQLTWPPG